MKTNRRIQFILILAVLAVSFNACVTDPISWSPDGRYIAFIGMSEQNLWLWDNLTSESKILAEGDVIACRFLPDGEHVLFGLEKNNKADFFKLNIHSNHKDTLVQQAAYYFDTSDDGRSFYFLRENNKQNSVDLWQKDLSNDEEKLLFTHRDAEINCVDADPTGTRFLMTVDEHYIALWEKGNSEPRLLREDSENMLVWPQWLDENRYLYFKVKDNEDTGALILASLDKKETEILSENAMMWDLPSISPDRKSLIFTQKVSKNTSQLVLIHTDSDECTVLTNDPMGGGWAAVDRNWTQVAYITGEADSDSRLQVCDLNTYKKHMIFRDEEERSLAVAESLYNYGETALAVRSYHDLIALFPGGRFTDFAWFRIMQLYLTPPYPDIDKAFEALSQMDSPTNIVQTVFWSETDRTASDPAHDWIAKYTTPEANAKFELDTDLTRDLLGLSVKCSQKRMFFKIDYNSNRDLSGLTFMDTVILLDYDSPNDGYRKITDQTEWDRGADRIIILRHWYQNGINSQYNLAILNGRGETISHFLASGFAPPKLPHVEIIEIPGYIDTKFLETMENKITDTLSAVGVIDNNSKLTVSMAPHGDAGSLLLSVSKDMLDMKNKDKVFVQVCTLKGGIESFEKLERPVSAVIDGKPVCDIADTFGEENTLGRILNDAKANKPIIIKGHAAEIDLKK